MQEGEKNSGLNANESQDSLLNDKNKKGQGS